MRYIANIGPDTKMMFLEYAVIDLKATGLSDTEQAALTEVFRWAIIGARRAREASFDLEDFRRAREQGLTHLTLKMQRFEMETEPVLAFWTGVFEGPGQRMC